MIDMIMDQGPLCFGHGAFHRMKLGRQIKTAAPLLNHQDDAAQMPFGTFQPAGNRGMACMYVRFYHMKSLSPVGG